MDCPQHVFVKGDIGRCKAVEALSASIKVDAIVNFAAESHVDRSLSTRHLHRDQRQGTTQPAEGRAGKTRLERFVQVSTDEVYGSLGTDGFFTESTPLSPPQPVLGPARPRADMLVRGVRTQLGPRYNINAMQ